MRQEPRLQFTKEERAAPALEKPIRKADRAADKAEKARAKAAKSNRTVTSLYVERWYTYILAAYVIKKDRKDDKNGI